MVESEVLDGNLLGIINFNPQGNMNFSWLMLGLLCWMG